MYYADSVEEQRFLSAVRREKDAFSKLIQEKGVSVRAPSRLNSILTLRRPWQLL